MSDVLYTRAIVADSSVQLLVRKHMLSASLASQT